MAARVIRATESGDHSLSQHLTNDLGFAANSDFYRLSADDGPVWWLRGDPRCEPAWRPIGLSPSVRVPISSSGDQALEERTFSPSAIGPQAHVHRLFVWLMRVSTSLRYELAQAVPAHCLVAKLPRRRDLRRGRIPALTQPEHYLFRLPWAGDAPARRQPALPVCSMAVDDYTRRGSRPRVSD